MDTSAGLVNRLIKGRLWLVIAAVVVVTAGAYVYQQQRLAAERARVQSQVKAQQEAAATESPDATATPHPTLTPLTTPQVKGAQTSRDVTNESKDDTNVTISNESHQMSEGEGASNYSSNTTDVNVNGSSSCSSTVTINGKTTKKNC